MAANKLIGISGERLLLLVLVVLAASTLTQWILSLSR
jgi:hypothetical protein